MIIVEGRISMDPVKVEAVCNWVEPKNLRELKASSGSPTSTEGSSKGSRALLDH